MRKVRSTLKILTGKPIANRPLERLRHRWEDNINIRTELTEIDAKSNRFDSPG